MREQGKVGERGEGGMGGEEHGRVRGSMHITNLENIYNFQLNIPRGTQPPLYFRKFSYFLEK